MNWQEHILNFNKLRAENGISIREYADHYGLNANTARRYLRSVSGDQKNDHQKDGDQIVQVKAKKKAPPKSRTSSGTKTGKSSGSIDAPPPKQPAKSKKGKIGKMINPSTEIITHQKLPRGEGRRLTAGNEASMKHGRYSTPRPIDLGRANELMDSGYFESLEIDLMRRTLAHIELVERVRDRSVAKLIEQEADFNEKEDGLHPVFKQLKMLNDCSYAMTDAMRTLASIKQVFLRNQRDTEKHQLKMGETSVISEAYELQEQLEWDAMQTAIYIESHGGKVPPALMEQLRYDMKQEPPVEDAVVIDADELDRQAREYRKKQASTAVYLEEKRRLVDGIVDRGGYGDQNGIGEGREGEMLDDTEEAPDYDYEATKDLYTDED